MFSQELRDDVLAGEITVSFRLWKRPKVKVGGRYPVGPGQDLIEVDYLERVPFAAITAADVRRAGEPDRETLRRRAAHAGPIDDDTLLYRVEFHAVPVVSLFGVRILILGGTSEARELACALIAAGLDVVSSLAGRVRDPRLPEGAVRIGGFGGADGLAAYLRAEAITAVVDATHPFASGITANAARAAGQAGIPLLVLRRAEWDADPSWDVVADIHAAAAAVRAWAGDSVFLTTGRRDLAAFAGDSAHRFLVRTVDPPDGPVPARMTLIMDRGPYTDAAERALMREHGVGLLVTKNSGGPMTVAKLRAARDLGAGVVMVARPPLPDGVTVVATVDEAVRWAGPGSAGPGSAGPGSVRRGSGGG